MTTMPNFRLAIFAQGSLLIEPDGVQFGEAAVGNVEHELVVVRGGSGGLNRGRESLRFSRIFRDILLFR